MTMTTTERDWVKEIGTPAFDTIAEMVAAVQVDYDRLEELRDDRERWNADADNEPWEEEFAVEADELAELESDAGDCESEDDARQRIDDDQLSIEVGGWWSPGSEAEPTEYRILLGTGGPAVRIVGDLGQHGEPSAARLEVQDWFKPWTEYSCDDDILLKYAACFYFGE